MKIDEASKPRIPYAKTYYQFTESRRIRAAERTGQVRQQALEQVYIRKANLAKNMMRFSPASMYDLATEAWTGTDFYSIVDFILAVQLYRRTLIDYFHDEGNLFLPAVVCQ